MHRSLEMVADSWTAAPLSTGWSNLVGESVQHLATDERSLEPTARAWQQLAMLFGDSGAPELCAVVSLNALAAPGDQEGTLRSHLHLALLDLGLAHAAIPDELIRLVELDTAVTPDPGPLHAWLAGFLAPVGELEAGAELCLRLAAIRAGLHPRPDPFALAAVVALSL